MNDQTIAETANNNTFQYDMEILRGRYAELTENELNAAVALMMLAHSAPPQIQTTPENNNEQAQQSLEPPKTWKITKVSYERIPQTIDKQHNTTNNINATNTIGSANCSSRPIVNRSPSTQKLLSTCRNILTEFMRNNIR